MPDQPPQPTDARSIARSLLAPLTALLTLGLIAGPAAAQRVVSTLDVGGVRVRYADSVSATAAAVSPTVRADWERATFTAAGTASQLGVDDWSTQGALAASVLTPAAGPLVGELAGSMGGSAHRDGTRTGQTLVVGRAHVTGTRAGLWGGGGVGQTWDSGIWRGVRLGEAGAWARFGAASILAAVTPTSVDEEFRYTDATFSLHVDFARAELGASAGVRSGERLPTFGGSVRSWGGASATVWLTESVGVVAGAGSYPVDPTQGFPGGRYATLSLRIASHGARRVAADVGKRTARAERDDNGEADRASDPRVLAFQAAAAPDGGRVLRVHAPSAAKVEIAGDFSAWQPVSLARAENGWWTVALPISRGVHQANLRVDGGAWLVPPGLDSVADEFGGTVGLLVIEQ